MNRLLAQLLVVAACSGRADAQGAETWECQEGPSYWQQGRPVLVVATINDDQKTGSVRVAGTIHPTAYRVEGFNRRWDFGPILNDSLRYVFLITPDGESAYYDFAFGTSPSQTFFCKRA